MSDTTRLSPNSNLTPLILIQKRIIKKCLNKPIDYSSELLFTDFNVLKIKQIYYIALLIFMHKNRNKFKLYHHKYGAKRSDFIRLEEPKCFTSTALSHVSGVDIVTASLYHSDVLQTRMAKPNPLPDLKQRVKTLEGQVRLLLPLIEEDFSYSENSIVVFSIQQERRSRKLVRKISQVMMAKPNPLPDLKQRVKTLEGQVRVLLPLIEEVRVLKERLDSRSLHGLGARKEEEKVGSSNNIEELKEKLKLRERELRETQAELEKLKEESEREKVELRQKYEEEHQLRLQQEK
ncbi:hypothetical protein ANN_00115, partial [Periplaneta americana]